MFKEDTIVINDAPVDELILNTILILNEKGYITTYSCQGHSYLGIPNIYIKFKQNDINNIFKKYKKVRLPKGFEYESTDIIRKYIKGDNVVDIDLEIIKSNKALEKWAKRLPNINEIS